MIMDRNALKPGQNIHLIHGFLAALFVEPHPHQQRGHQHVHPMQHPTDAQAEAPALYPSRKNPPVGSETTSVARAAAAPALFPSMQKRTAARNSPLLVRAAPASVVSRIELQTTNPNVRIIWLVGAQPARPPEADSEDGI